MEKISLRLFVLLFCFNYSSAQTFSNSVAEAAGSWNGTLTKTVNVSGISNLNAGTFELVQVNLSMGDNANTRNYNSYKITLTKGTTSIELVATGGFPNSTVKQINTKFRFNPYLRRLFEHGGTAEPFSVGYYRSQDNFTAFNGIDPNGTWTVTITETSFATGGRFNAIDLVFKTPYTVQDYTTLNSYDNCATPYCLGTAEIIVASNNGFTNQPSDMYNPNTVGCSWNAAQNNSAWFKFRAAQTNASISISAITNNLQILAIDAGPDANPCTTGDNTVLNGGCPTLLTNDTYATPQYTNGSTKNNQLNLSGLTIGNYYYFIVDGTSSAVSPFYIETLGASLDCSNCNLNPIVGSNSPVCENSTLNLTCSEGVSWEWSGPNGFSSTAQNPTLSNVSALANGTYTVTITDANSCIETRTVEVQISAVLTPQFNATNPVCSGTTINALPTTSNNGIEGQWSPALNNTSTTTYTFTPNLGQCATNASLTIQINNCDFGAYASAVWMDDCFTAGDGKFYNTTGTGTDLINQEPGNTFIQNFGVHLQNSSTLIMRGAEVKTYKNGNTNVCGAKMYYRYYLNSGTAGNFTSRNLGFFSDCNTGINEFFVGGGPCQSGQQKWQCVSQPSCDTPINLTNTAPGEYTLEVYYEITGDFNSTSQCDDAILLNNGGTNYKAFFSIIPLPEVNGTNPTLCNVPNGSITISGLTSNEVYALQYTLGSTVVGPINYTSNDQGSIELLNLGVGTYSNFTFEINNCITLLPSVINLQNPIITPVFSTPNPICNGATIDSTVFPTTSNNGITGVWSPEFNNNLTTVYTFSPALNQCAIPANLTLVVNSAITGSTTSNPNTVCNATSTACNGTATVSIASGSGNYSYLWNDSQVQTSATAINLCAGNYCVTVTDLDTNCTQVFCITVNDDIPLVNPAFSFGNNLTICVGATAPSLPATSTNGIQGTWTPAVIDNTTSGTYTFTPNPSGSSSNLIVNGDFSQGNSNFSTDYQFITNAGQGGVQRAYGIVSSANSWFQFFPPCTSNAPSGGNMMVVDGSTSNAGNDKVWGQTVTVLPNKTYTFSYWLQTIATPNQALIEVKINGTSIGTALAPNTNCQTTQHTYQWNSGSNTTAQIEFFDRIFASNGNDFSLDDISFVENSPQCASATTLSVTVTPQTTPTFSFGTTLSICSGGIVPALPTSSSNSITGTWSPAIVDNANNGTYTFTPNTGQCANTNTFTVTLTPQTTPTFSFGNNLTICVGATAPSLPATSSNGIQGTWTPAIIDNTTSGTYTFTPDANQCATTTPFTVTVTPQTTPTFSFGNSITACQGASIQVLLPTLSNNSITGTWNPSTIDYSLLGETVYTFTPDNGQCALNRTLNVTVNPIPQFTISGGCDGNDYVLEILQNNQNISTVDWYFNSNMIGNGNAIVISGEGTYTALASNSFGCESSAQFDVTNDFCTIPKGVSANNDGDNDNFDLSNLNVERLQIFNRWGMVVYEQKNYTDQWEGRSNDGKELPDGTYYYIIEQRSGKTFTGWVYLIRSY